MQSVETTRLQRDRARAGPASASVRLLLLFLLAPALLLPALPLHAQVEWAPEEQISLDDVYDDWFPRIAAGPDGRVWVVWRGIDGYDPEIMYSVNDGNGWSYPDRVNTDDYAEDTSPDIAVGPDGNPWVVWGKRVGGHSKLYWSRWEGDGWRPEERVFPDSANEPYVGGVHMTVGPDGLSWFALPWYVAGGRAICTSRCKDGAWTWPDTVACLSGEAECRLAGGSGGDLLVVVRNVVNDVPRMLYTYHEGGGWAPVDTVPGLLEMPRSLVVCPDGEAWIAWHSQGIVWAARYRQGVWSEPEVVSAPDSTGTGIGSIRAGGPDLGASADGLVWATWKEYYFGVGEPDPIVYASRRGTSSWTSKEQVSSGDGFVEGYNRIAISSGGAAWVVWQAWDGRDFEVLVSNSVGTPVRDQWAGVRSSGQFVWAPNPMQSSGCLWARVPAPIDGSMMLFDAAGRLVTRLEVSPGGSVSGPVTRWDGRNAHGGSVPSGTYVWRAQSGGQRHEGRIVVIK